MSEESNPREQQSAVIESARLMEVSLTNSQFAVDPDFRSEQEASDKFIDEVVLNTHFDADHQLLLGHVQCRVWMNRASDKTTEERPSIEEALAQSLFSVEAEYFVVFQLSGQHTEDSIKAFFERTGSFAAWPYFRALVSSFAAAAGVSVPVLPIKRVLVPFKAEGGYASGKELAVTNAN